MTTETRSRENHFEDRYIKYECRACKRCFILGETLSRGMELSCPYCRSKQVESVAASAEGSGEDMDMGCLGLYYSTYGDGSLMLYTEREFMNALSDGVPGESVMDSIARYCRERDGR